MITKFYQTFGGQPGRETCYCIESTFPLDFYQMQILRWIIGEKHEPELLSNIPTLTKNVLEIGPRLAVESPYSSTAIDICHAVGIHTVTRFEKMERHVVPEHFIREGAVSLFADRLHDKMTQQVFMEPITSFDTGIVPKPLGSILTLEEGQDAIMKANKELGLGMDADDFAQYMLLAQKLGRNLTDVEAFGLANMNSDHCRHHRFGGINFIDGVEQPESLMTIIKTAWKERPSNGVIAFGDNAMAIEGRNVLLLVPRVPGKPSEYVFKYVFLHSTLKMETHNHPSMIAPFPGAETGVGGELRDRMAVGRGGRLAAGGAVYCVGGLQLRGYHIPGEDRSLAYSEDYAHPAAILIETSNGAADYRNQFGEPSIYGATRSLDLVLPAGRRAFLKPVMASVGIGNIEDRHVKKHEPVKEMLIVQFGGPAFRIGLGGGAASSMVQGKNTASLDFGSVQRGNAQMAQRIRRVMDACIDLGDENPIESAHDQGAGGIGNVIPELVGMVGGLVNIREVNLGDNSLSVLEIWSAEYQERLAVLIKEESLELFRKICNRERVPCEVLGKVTGDGNITVIDPDTGTVPVKLPLQQILGNVPRKKFHFTRVPKNLLPLEIPALPFAEKLKMVLQQVAVGSKGYLVRKKDRSVGGCVAQQQCCGPMQLPVADFALVAKSHFDLCGTASSIGEKSPLNLIDPAKGARMALAEAILNLAGVVTEGVGNVKTSINWIWAMSVPGQGADLCDAAMALRDAMRTLQGGECLGGKDSLSAAATVNGETIASPGQCIITTIVGVDDIRKKVTPDLKGSYGTHIGFFDISLGNCRLGGSAFAQALGQIGNDCPDVDMTVLRRAADAIRELVDRELIISGHDRSDGGLITAAVEMSLAGNKGVDIEIRGRMDIDEFLLNEEAGYVVEYDPEKTRQIGEVLSWHGFEEDAIKKIGRTMATSEFIVTFSHYDATILALRESLTTLRAWWESTSNRLELEQKLDPDCAREQEESQRQVAQAEFSLTFVPKETPADWLAQSVKPKVAIIRDIGSNGDAEMVSAFTLAGFDAVGVNMTDLNDGRITLKGFRGIAFVGGFSNADVFGSAKGWAAKIKFSPNVSAMFQAFYEREDTFSFGVCNGCQLMALLGWIPGDIEDERRQVRFMQNKSKRFDSRWVRMRIEKSPAMMFRGMEGSVLGGIVAHGEGRFFAPDGSVLDGMLKRNLVPVVYVDGQNQVTQKYPYNPNGSPEGIAAACSPNGRHLAMMPHPERTFKMWQWHYAPPEYGVIEESPWLTMFQNARRWCEEVREV